MVDADYQARVSHQGIGYGLWARLDEVAESFAESGIARGDARRIALRETIDPQSGFQRRIGRDWYQRKG